MAAFSARNRLVLWLLAAGIGLALFFTGEYRDLDLPLGWIGTVLFVAATWFSVDALYRVPQSEEEAAVAPGEWQAWIGVAFVGAIIVASLPASVLTCPAWFTADAVVRLSAGR